MPSVAQGWQGTKPKRYTEYGTKTSSPAGDMPPCQDIRRGPPLSEIPVYVEARPRNLFPQTGEGPGTAVILSFRKSIGH